MKGQGSTEYLVIFAAVLVVALIVIFLLGQFTGFGRESLVDQSKGYWSGKKPIAITDWSVTTASGNDTITILLKNNDVEKIEIVNVTVTGGTSTKAFSINSNLTSGSTTTSTLSTLDVCSNTGDIAELSNVVIYYKKPSVSSSTTFAEAGTMPIRMQCG